MESNSHLFDSGKNEQCSSSEPLIQENYFIPSSFLQTWCETERKRKREREREREREQLRKEEKEESKWSIIR